MVHEFNKRYTLIAACKWEGFVQEACHIVEREHVKDDPNPDCGTVDTGRFQQYLENFVVPVLGRAKLQETNSILAMDNAAPIHYSDKIRSIIENVGALLVYIAP